MNKSCSYNFQARPSQLLIDHLRSTSNYCLEISKLKFSNDSGISGEFLADIAYLIGFTHDLGKATRYFQDYVTETDKIKQARLKNKDETRHSLLSSLFTYRIISDYIAQKGFTNHAIYKYLPVLSFLVVKRHHGNPKNLKDEIKSLGGYSNTFSIVNKQLASIEAVEFDRILNECPDINISLADFAGDVEKLIDRQIRMDEKKNWRRYCKNSHLDIYFIFQFMYSSLLSADKRDAIGIDESNEIPIIESNLVDRYREKKFKNHATGNLIDPMRNEIYSEMATYVSSLDIKNKIFSINVPTGTGKTLTGLSFALKLREKVSEKEGFTPKIIYCLPFLSIIEQNYSVFEDIFEVVKNTKPDNSLLLKHHHLAEIAYRFKDDEDLSIDESQFLIEGWKSEIVVTTFIQLFHTMISNKNRMVRKFNAMANAIIILDEIQTVPYKYWHLIRKLFLGFASFFNTRFVMMTATQPLIFDEDEIVEVISPEKKKQYIEKLDRITFINQTKQTMILDEFKQIIKDDISKYPQDDFLFVLNTINCSIDVFNHLKSFFREKSLTDTELYYLSTNIIPKHRLQRINSIKKSKKRKIIVSTQLVEAGVDIDVDRVYRDFAPLDSLNQVAGRCNRNFSDGRKGVVSVFALKNGRPYYRYIYGKSDLSILKTKDVLEKKTDGSEKDFLEFGNEYFKLLKDAAADDRSENMLDMLSKLDFEDACENKDERFALIESKYPTSDMFMKIDSNAEDIWKQFKAAYKIEDPFRKKAEINRIKKEFYSYIISVPTKTAANSHFENSTIRYINKEQLETTYDKCTGFIRSPQEQYIF